MERKKLVNGFLLLVSFVLVTHVSKAQDYVLGTGPAAGTYIQFGEDIKQICGGDLPIKSVETSGSVSNFKDLQASKVNFAILQYDVLQHYEGAKGLEDIKMLFPLYDEEFHLIALKNSSINKLSDLKGKKVAIGTVNSGFWLTAKNLQKMTGVTFQEVEVTFEEGLKSLIDKKVDAVFYVAGAPSKTLGKLPAATADAIKLVPIESSSLNAEGLHDLYIPSIISQKAYPWLDQDVVTFSVKSILVTHDYAEGEKGYEVVSALVATLLDNLKKLNKSGHPKWKEVCPSDYALVPWDIHVAAKTSIDTWAEKGGTCSREQ